MLFGSSFHQSGPTQLNDLAANVFSFVNGTTSLLVLLAERSPDRLMGVKAKRFCKYAGPFPESEMNTKHNTLNRIRSRIGSQWSSLRHLLGLSYQSARFTNFAAIFWTL